MANIIAVIWDFDKTLISGYMQEPIFQEYGVDPSKFWKEVEGLPEKYMRDQGVRVNKDTIYLNHFISETQKGTFAGLNNQKLKSFGDKLNFYAGIPNIFIKTKELIAQNEKYKEYDIRVEHYIVSTGFAEVIKGSIVAEHVKDIWGCELIEDIDENGDNIISQIAYTIDNTTKTRALFEINKGVGIHDNLDVNTKVPAELRRIPFENMIYIADGPSDIPAFSVVNKNGGATFAIYPKGDAEAFSQVENMRRDNRVQMYAEADYSENSTAYMWITSKIQSNAERIYVREKQFLSQSISETPRHLN